MPTYNEVVSKIIYEFVSYLTCQVKSFMSFVSYLTCQVKSFMSFVSYLTCQIPLEELMLRTLQVTVWDHGVLTENSFLGAVYIKIKDLQLPDENVNWYNLDKLQVTTSGMLA
ncbi:hypothetical protein KUTeg_023214 [Tegillarca granosa]|uniref:C2 domain-containing protein n=1 Tax=Tegillarca granosa TaxID=220873 RepID=A0ABQ9E1D3_TEGGR|nr:hypothetical protein KUTeg_023214 [Tegillarca granosa]